MRNFVESHKVATLVRDVHRRMVGDEVTCGGGGVVKRYIENGNENERGERHEKRELTSELEEVIAWPVLA